MAKKVTSGEKFRFSAQSYNEMNQLIESQRMSRLSVQAQSSAVNNDHVLVKNNSGTSVARFGILQISGILFDPQTAFNSFASRVVFKGVTPAEPADGRFLICAEPIASGAIGRAWVDGVAIARVSVSDASHAYAAVLPGDITTLKSAESGLCYILWKESGTGTKWAVVRFGAGASGGDVRWAFYKAYKNGGTCTAYLGKNLTGQVVDVYFILTGGCTNHTEGHITILTGLRMPVMRDGETWICIYPLQGVEVCYPT